MITLLASSAILLLSPATEKWDIKPNFVAKSITVWATTIEANDQGTDHRAKFSFVQTITSTDAKSSKAKITWKDLEVDDNPTEGTDFMVTLGPRGEILSAESAEWGDDVRRMLSIFAFIYPEKPVGADEKWTFEMTPADGKRKVTATFEAAGVEKIKDADTLKVKATFGEKGDDGIQSNGTFWISKAGKPVKFELKVKKWVVPMAGSGPIDATIKGEIIDK